MVVMIEKFILSKNGGTSIEYALIASFIFMVIAVTLPLIAPELNIIFGKLNITFDDANKIPK